ncbi:MAG TPA: type II secretion system protein [Tepidisphaeraceae bacterium]|jgi:prepilin-type N-terminal cleavage/methylation domain-containing protein/prepilin-type processing-associated H-X9-DG protein
MRRRQIGFTLVELLVVIGIIAVLIGMLLPALSGARRSAATVKCAAHLRDLGNAIQMYANEHQYTIPTQQSNIKVGASTITVMWYDQLAKYVFKSGVASGTPASVINDVNFSKTTFVGCPANDFRYYKANPIRTATGYGLNLTPLAPNPDPDTKQPMNVYPGTPSQPGRYFKIKEFRNPSNRALMADANGYGGIQAKDPDPLTVYTPPAQDNQFGDADYYRHGKLYDLSRPGCNVLFADLHVDLCSPWGAFWAIKDPGRKANTGN